MEIEDKVTSPPRPPHPPPPSAITSPSHDFSFTISFQTLNSPATLRGSAAKSPSASSGAFFDLAPADDIFLHGHLLPLHLLSHPGSPLRDSDISLENFRFPLGHSDSDRNLNYFDPGKAGAKAGAKEESRATKPQSALAAFFGLGKLRKRNEKEGAEAAATTTTTKRKKKGIDVIRLLRKYANLVELLFFFRTGERERRRREDDLRQRPSSFSGHSNRNSKAEVAAQGEWRRRKKGQMSAPASMRTSPTNSGLLSASSMTISSTSTSTSDNSTMEELQSAIQAAIAHCKNSIAVAAKQRAGET